MTTIERIESHPEHDGGPEEIAVTIVDTDVHPIPVSPDVLKSYAPAEWVGKIWPTG
ncbi:MAG: amidohydrolase, partial [Mycobacterium sp.]|nr:amidohydrolase [Mycobacterium sp.]